MTDLRIRITESDGIRYATGVNPYASTLYIGENVPEALDAILEGLQGFRDIPAMVRALHFCPEFCQLAAAVHGLHLAESDETPTTEAIAILTKLRDSRQPEAIRTRAGNLLIDIAEDDRAVCDASSVDGVAKVAALPDGWQFPKCNFCGCGIWPDGTGHHSALCVDTNKGKTSLDFLRIGSSTP